MPCQVKLPRLFRQAHRHTPACRVAAGAESRRALPRTSTAVPVASDASPSPPQSPRRTTCAPLALSGAGNAVPCAGLARPCDTPGVLGTAVPCDSMPTSAVPCVAPPGASPALPRAAMVRMPAAMAGVAVAMPGAPRAVVRLQVACAYSGARVGCVAHAAAPCAAAPRAAAPCASMPGVAQLGAMLPAAPSRFLPAAMPLPSACSASYLTLSHVSGGGAQAQRYRSWPPLAQAVGAAPFGVPVCGAYPSAHSQGSVVE